MSACILEQEGHHVGLQNAFAAHSTVDETGFPPSSFSARAILTNVRVFRFLLIKHDRYQRLYFSIETDANVVRFAW